MRASPMVAESYTTAIKPWQSLTAYQRTRPNSRTADESGHYAIQGFLHSIGEAKPCVELVTALFYGFPIPSGEIEIHRGFSAEVLRDCILAHLCSMEPKHEHKMAGVEYMLRQLATLKPGAETA